MVRADHRVPGTPEPASPWARGMDGVKHVLGIWIQDGEGASLKGAACAPGPANRGVLGAC